MIKLWQFALDIQREYVQLSYLVSAFKDLPIGFAFTIVTSVRFMVMFKSLGSPFVGSEVVLTLSNGLGTIFGHTKGICFSAKSWFLRQSVSSDI